MKTRFTIQLKHDPLCGYYCLVTVAGKTRYVTGYWDQPRDAESAAASWIEGYRAMEVASEESLVPLG